MNTPSDRTPSGPHPHGANPPWNPDHPAVFVVRDKNTSRVSLVRHDGYPYPTSGDANAVWDERTEWRGLFKIANDYLLRANEHLRLPQVWLDDLVGSIETRPPAQPDRVHLLWLDVENDPRSSYWVERHGGLDETSRPPYGELRDRTAVLLAGLDIPFMFGSLPGNFGQGLRIIVQAGPPQADNRVPVRITGVSSTLPLLRDGFGSAGTGHGTAGITREQLDALKGRILAAFGMAEDSVPVEIGFQVSDAPENPGGVETVRVRTAPTKAAQRSPYAEGLLSYQLVVRSSPSLDDETPIAKRPLITHADADLYVRDPVSKNGPRDFTRLRPNRSWLVLDPERENRPLGNLAAGQTGASKVQLEAPLGADGKRDFTVTNARLVDPPLAEGNPKEVADPFRGHVRSNDFAAVNAFYHMRDLFDRLRRYGLPPANYFKFVERPVIVRYRSGIFPGAGDGRAVNAQVRWTLLPKVGGTGTIEVCFALGDLQSAVGRLPANQPSAVERSPLGVASDPRWCWHEYCHVLLTAATGDLEFAFAHSAGDAMAAILCDPGSELANDRDGTLANNGPWRGITFPWVFIPRRHDRDVQAGWGWTGPMNGMGSGSSIPGISNKRGYWAEQILSSSLFRLYRAIGGDSEQRDLQGKQQKDSAARTDAADYALYLIMRTIQSLGAASVTPSTTPHDFVDAMRKVDTATASVPGPGGYVGGTVHKVIQWAFERQGLYGLPVPGSPVIGPEEVAKVDLHIEDLRPKPDGPYSPIDLNGTAWHVHDDAMWVRNVFLSRKKKVRVCVQNRGTQKAFNTRVDVWCAKFTGGTIPKYPDATWQFLGSQTRNVPGASNQAPGKRTFGPFKFTPAAGDQQYAILAAATCDADRSNIDPSTGHPCVTVTGPIQFLVACDNNLGLILVKTA